VKDDERLSFEAGEKRAHDFSGPGQSIWPYSRQTVQ